mmetsp:Transcript_139352/g.338539  ORF Transcript_139352/g.338539 Transcript_139352/m.338539 type:complete len:262 (-) Transcript_139352:551-1336(-)
MVKLDRNLQILDLGELDAAHVLHLAHASGPGSSYVRHANGVRHASAASWQPVRHAMDERHHGPCEIHGALLGGLRVDFGHMGLDEGNGEAIFSDACVGGVMPQHPKVGTGLGIHEPLAIDLTIELGNGAWQLIIYRVCSAAETIGSASYVDSELRRQLRLHSLLLWHVFRLCNDNALHRCELIIRVARIRAGHTIARTAAHIEQLLVVGVAAALLCLLRGWRNFWKPEAVNAAHMALLASHLGGVELRRFIWSMSGMCTLW